MVFFFGQYALFLLKIGKHDCDPVKFLIDGKKGVYELGIKMLVPVFRNDLHAFWWEKAGLYTRLLISAS